jgi:hypothetical protein
MQELREFFRGGNKKHSVPHEKSIEVVLTWKE